MSGVIDKAEQALLEHLQQTTTLSDIDLKSLRSEKLLFMKQRPDIAHDPTLLRTTFLQHFLANKGIPESRLKPLSQELMTVFLTHRNKVTLFESTLSTLGTIQDQFKLASLTNGNACLKSIGLNQYFDFNVSPAIAGVKKPDSGIFQYLIKTSNIQPNEILHIGDHWEDDIVGAQQAGLHALWINPEQAAWPGEPQMRPKGIISDISEAPAYIRGFTT